MKSKTEKFLKKIVGISRTTEPKDFLLYEIATYLSEKGNFDPVEALKGPNISAMRTRLISGPKEELKIELERQEKLRQEAFSNLKMGFYVNKELMSFQDIKKLKCKTEIREKETCNNNIGEQLTKRILKEIPAWCQNLRDIEMALKKREVFVGMNCNRCSKRYSISIFP